MATSSLDTHQLQRMLNFLKGGLVAPELLNSKGRNHLESEANSMCHKAGYKKIIQAWRKDGKGILNHCATNEKHLMLELLLKYYKLNPNDIETDRPTLHFAAEKGDIKAVNCLLQGFHKANVDGIDSFGTTALHVAIFYDKIDVLQKLLHHNARTDVENFMGTAVHTAIICEKDEMLRAILKKYPDQVDRVVQGFCSPYLCAILDDADDCENSLINVCDVKNKSFLYSLISFKHDESAALKAVKVLLQRGANGDLVEEGEIIPIIAAARKKWLTVIDVLLPVTTQINDVEWSISGLVTYVESEKFMIEDKARNDASMQAFKARIVDELKRDRILAAILLCQLLKSCIHLDEWKWYNNLCLLVATLKMKTEPCKIDAENLFCLAEEKLAKEHYEESLMAAMGALALVPDPYDKKYQDKLSVIKDAPSRTTT